MEIDLFPFTEKREKQKEMLEKVEEVIENGENLVTHAPTGLGKTAAALTPALEERLRNDKKAFFVTPRNSQHEIALETIRKINERHGKNLIAVDLIGKDHLCEADSSTRAGKGPDCPRHSETIQNHQLTEKARKRLDNLKYRNLSAEQVKRECREVCPYQILIHMTQEADLIIGDYFHVFHPAVREIVLEKAETKLEDSVIVVDEAHNLPGRTRSLFSSTISTGLLERCKTETEKFGYYTEQEKLDQFRQELFRMSREELGQDSFEKEIDKQELKDLVNSFHGFEEMLVDLDTIAEEVEEEQEKSFCRQLEEAMEKWKGKDEGFVRAIKREKEEVKIQYSCLNPQISTKKPLNASHSSILMSGTLTPPKMYVDLLGLEENLTHRQEFGSPFPQENKEELVVPSLTTKYEERGDSMTQKYAWILKKSLEKVPGNAAAFFPSYNMLKEIRKELKGKTDRIIYTETRRMGKEEKQDTLKQFENRSEEGDGLLLGVAAGSFGEGIDYPGEVLKAAFIIGLPLQRPDLETKALIGFLDEKFGKGWDYGYSYPAMNRAIQAAGRCIRSKEDRGVIVYMDKRYSWSNYRKVFPPDTQLKKTKAPWREIKEFFK
jgi:DNA excision repair protein ERCC-2